jgi:hypothetical protein
LFAYAVTSAEAFAKSYIKSNTAMEEVFKADIEEFLYNMLKECFPNISIKISDKNTITW